MPAVLRKLLLLAGAVLLAAAITYFPWWILWNIQAEWSTLYRMSAILWAPLALIAGLGAGAMFAWFFWPRA